MPFAASFCARRLTALGGRPQLRMREGKALVTDNGNHIIDCGVEPLRAPREFDEAVRAIAGVVGTGLFLGIADVVLVGEAAGVRAMTRAG